MQMFRPNRRWAVLTGIAVTLALTTPALASAQASSAPPKAAQPMKAQAFPSADSTVIASTGFLDDYEVGYFWSASRGDSVEQTFKGPKKITKAVLKLDVTYNGLSGAETDWSVSINGTDVGSFVIGEGVTGQVKEKMKFKAIKGKTYDVKMYMTNEVPSGAGSIALRYAEDGWHSIALKKK